MTTYITVAIPYVNARPHIGYAFELVEADLAARARRQLGESVRFSGGTDDYSLKNALAAEAAGEPTQHFVDRHAPAVRTARRPARDHVRRLHPNEPRPTSPTGGRTTLASL